ncbi:MAG TPA: tRNA glutamyl-Q(34) synthetase GluQRS [Woeseiaceae bacterium]
MANEDSAGYVGRFAPSPTGPLHFGSLLAATASYLEAKTNSGKWLLRIEDIDPPRASPHAEKYIIEALESYGFEWHGSVQFQSSEIARHLALVDQLLADGLAYPCGCSRQDLADVPRGPLGHIYPGTCRRGCDDADVAIRIRTNVLPVAFYDGLQGPQEQRLETESGDFVIRRRDGLIAYHLAVVADDFAQGVTDVVRGIDLLDSTPRQIYLQQVLGYPTPRYAHIPIVTNAAGEKLSKATGAAAVPTHQVRPTLIEALIALGQSPPAELADCHLDGIWSWARENWNMGVLAGQTCVPMPR